MLDSRNKLTTVLSQSVVMVALQSEVSRIRYVRVALQVSVKTTPIWIWIGAVMAHTIGK